MSKQKIYRKYKLRKLMYSVCAKQDIELVEVKKKLASKLGVKISSVTKYCNIRFDSVNEIKSGHMSNIIDFFKTELDSDLNLQDLLYEYQMVLKSVDKIFK